MSRLLHRRFWKRWERCRHQTNILRRPVIQFGIYYAYWTHDWDVDFVPYITRVKKLGFDVLEVNAGTIARLGRKQQEKLRKTASDNRIALTAVVGLTKEFDISSEDKNTRERGIRFLNRIADAMHECGIRKLGGIIYGMWPGMLNDLSTEANERERAWDRSVLSMKEAVKKAEDLGLIYNVEVVNRFEQFLINTCEDAVNYIDEVGSPNCKVMLDTFHMNIEEDSFAGAIECAGNNLGHFHVGENNRKPPGYGHIPWDEIGSALKRIGYDDTVVMEPFLMKGGEVGRDIRVFKDIMPTIDMDREAEKACRFLREKFA